MSIDEGKLNRGIDYQFEIITYTAACLSENLFGNRKVEDFQIYTNQKIPSFDDIIVKVKYESEEKPFVYLGQIRRYKKDKINFNEGKDRLQQYLNKISTINDKKKRGTFLKNLLKGVPQENIEFWYISNSFLLNYNNYPSTDPLTKPIVLDDGTNCYLEADSACKPIFPLQHGVAFYKLITKVGQQLPNNLSKMYFFLKQPDHNQIASSIVNLDKDLISMAMANNIINFVNAFLKQSAKAKLTKYIFETHLLRLCLSPFIVSPTEAVQIDPKLAEYWNKLVMEFDVTMASSEMEFYIFGCLWEEMIKLYGSHFNWKDAITKSKKITEEISIEDKFMQLVQDRGVKHWLYVPDTIKGLLIEMWKCDYLPLVLSAYTDVSILAKYKHLGKRFVILHRNEKLNNEISCFGLRVFANAADIRDIELAKEFLESILISLQGRKPIGLLNILNGDRDLMMKLKCDQLLYLIRERKNLLSSDEDFETGRVKDEDGNDFYVEKGKVVPIIGKCFTNSEKYIKRCLRKPTVEKTISNSERRIICFLTGHLNLVDWNKRNYYKYLDEPIGNIVSTIELQAEQQQSTFLGIKDEYVEELWSRFSLREHSLLHIKVENSMMLLLKYRNCPNLSSYISYSGPEFKEESFFEETSTGITVITGEPGSGKSTLLRSLFNACPKHCFALFCDLKDYRQEICKRNADLFKDPINFMLRKEEAHLTFSTKQYSKYHLNFLHKILGKTKEVILFLDSFDEVLPECEDQILEFVRILNNSNRRFIIASRLVMAGILGNTLEVKLLKIDTLSKTDIEKYLNNEQLPETEFNQYPFEFRKNPLYLNFLITLHRENALPSVITPSTLYNAVIEKHIKHFYDDHNLTPKQYEYKREEYLQIFKQLALIEVLDDSITTKLDLDYEKLREKCTHTDKLKLGLIVQFYDKGPIFLHRTIAEFLVAEWLSENIKNDYGKNMYMILLEDYEDHICHLLDDILCRNLTLHQAVIQKDFSLVKNLCSADDKYLRQVDILNRTALDIAAIYYSNWETKEQNCLILEEILHRMIIKKIDFSERNPFTGKHWTDYLRDDYCLDRMASLNLVHSPAMYFRYQNKIEDGISWAIEKNQLDTAMAMLKTNGHLLPTYFVDFAFEVITEMRLDLLSQLVELERNNNAELDILCSVCNNLLPVSDVSKCANLKMEGGLTAVHVACICGCADVVKELVSLGNEVNAVDDFQLRPLYYAIGNGSVEIVTILAELFKKEETLPISSSRQKIFPNYLHNSLSKNYLKIAKILLDNRFEIDARDENGKTALYVAVENRKRIDSVGRQTLPSMPDNDDSNINQIRLLLEYKADCNIHDDEGQTPLHIAVRNERLDVTEMLLRHGANTSIKCQPFEDTPLHLAVGRGNNELVKLLLQYHADVNITNEDEETALFAMCGGRYKISLEYNLVETLVSAGANINHKNNQGNTALHKVVWSTSEEPVRILLDFGADVNAETDYGDTALMVAAKENYYEHITILLEKGAKINHQNRNGNTALHIAVKKYFLQIFKKVCKDIGSYDHAFLRDEVYDTILLNAVEMNRKLPSMLLPNIETIVTLLTGGAVYGNEIGDTRSCTAADILKILIDNGADVNVANEEGQTALGIINKYKTIIDSHRSRSRVQKISRSVQESE